MLTTLKRKEVMAKKRKKNDWESEFEDDQPRKTPRKDMWAQTGRKSNKVKKFKYKND